MTYLEITNRYGNKVKCQDTMLEYYTERGPILSLEAQTVLDTQRKAKGKKVEERTLPIQAQATVQDLANLGKGK